MSDDDLMTQAAAFSPEAPEASSKEDRAHARRKSAIRIILVGTYLYVVFGILLPRIVDYGAVLDAFRAAPPEWLVVVFLVGIAAWITEGMALNAVLPELGIVRGTVTFLSMAAVGSTVPGPIKMAFGFRLFRGWGISTDRAALGLTINGLATQAIRAKAKRGTRVGPVDNITVAVPAVESAEHIRAAEVATRELNAPYLTVMLEGRYTDEYLAAAGAGAPRYTDQDLTAIATPAAAKT